MEWSAVSVGGLAAATGITGAALYLLSRRRRPSHVAVNCWFCNQNSVVPYGNRNCWDCPNCEQYNGFQENGDYNKPIPAQHSEHLNHVVSGSSKIPDIVQPQQWVNCQMLLCKKCNNNQTTKIKQLASFVPREEDKYDEEIEVYKHHLEQTYKLCRPCQTAVEYYIKHQNRQLRALLLDHHLKRRELNKCNMQSFGPSSSQAPLHVIILRFLAFLSCAFLLSLAVWGSGDLFSSNIKDSVNSSLAQPQNQSHTVFEHVAERPLWVKILDVVPKETFDNLNVAWRFGQTHQIEVVVLGLVACVFAIFLAGRVRLRRVDAFASFLWLLVACLYLSERYLAAKSFSWLDTVKLGTTSLCCLVGFTSAFATRKAAGQQKPRPRRFISNNGVSKFGTVTSSSGMSDFTSPLLSIPPGLLQLINQRLHRSKSKEYQYSLPGRLSKVLSLGTIPTFSRTDSGYLFSGSRPSSRASGYKDSPGSDYFSLLSGSRASSPLPSPTPSIAGSATSSSGSLHQRRPLISPARLNLQGQKLGFSPTMFDGKDHWSSNDNTSHPDSSVYPLDFTQIVTKSNSSPKFFPDSGSVSSNAVCRKDDNSSHSSTCKVDTTTEFIDSAKSGIGCNWIWLVCGFLILSLTVNLLFISVYMYPIHN